jgi:dihydrodipicolinate reductase
MQVLIAGSGKLATELLRELVPDAQFTIAAWPGNEASRVRSIVVHAGSGRELAAISAFCKATTSVLVELATGSLLAELDVDYPAVICPNTNILMLKFMCMLERSGKLFKDYSIRITESHQASKTSTAGTAVAIANALGLPVNNVVSVRDPVEQSTSLGIPRESLSRHAFHRIEIEDGSCQITTETRIYGNNSYARGVQQIVSAIAARPLENRVYWVNEFIENGWI